MIATGFRLMTIDDEKGTVQTVNEDGSIEVLMENGVNDTFIHDDERVKYIINPDIEDPLLNSAKLKMSYLTFRRKHLILTKKSAYENGEFFYGFTIAQYMRHFDNRLPSKLYYQAGDYCELLIEDGSLEFDEAVNRKERGQFYDFMCGIAVYNERGDRYVKWFYCGNDKCCPFYNLYLLIMFGSDWYIFKGMSQERILDMLYCPEKEHLYQAYALTVYYKQPIPDEWGLDDYAEKIKRDLIWWNDRSE